ESLSMFCRSGRFGSHGVSTGASMASSTRMSTTTPPTMARRFFAKARQKFRMPSATAAADEADPRVDQPVGEVGHEIGDQRERGHEDEVAHDDGIVALEDGLHHELAHPGDREDGLDDDAAADEAGQRQPEDGDERQQRVAKRVLADYHPLGQALRARRL